MTINSQDKTTIARNLRATQPSGGTPVTGWNESKSIKFIKWVIQTCSSLQLVSLKVGMQRRISSCPPQLALEHPGNSVPRDSKSWVKLPEGCTVTLWSPGLSLHMSAHHTKSERLCVFTRGKTTKKLLNHRRLVSLQDLWRSSPVEAQVGSQGHEEISSATGCRKQLRSPLYRRN